jgi:hypothetical protein
VNEEGRMAEMLVRMVREDAVEWSQESGLKGKLSCKLEVKDFGFVAVVDSDNGSQAVCTYQCNGMRSMYELSRKEGQPL